MTKPWTDPRDGTRWLIVRRQFHHGCFGYLPRSTLKLASAEEYWVVPEVPGAPSELVDDYLMGVLDEARKDLIAPHGRNRA